MKRTICYLSLLLSFLLTCSEASAQPFRRKWVDSVYNSLNEVQRIGQLFMVAAYSAGPKANQEHIERLLKARQIGGLIFMQGTAEDQARLTNRYQKMSPVPLLIGMDAEWGLGMRLTGVRNFPRQMSIGATRDTGLMYKMGVAVARQCKRLGVHIDFAPVVDVNNNPANPVINFRSFGEDKKWVADLGIAYMKGLQDNGIMACAKHFPGHGDVSVDSHHDLPVIGKSRQELEDMELYPFRKLIVAGVRSIMIAHLHIPALDKTANLPATLSRPVITGLLKEEMGFDGLVFTDALDMKGVTKYFPDGETDLRAFLAGNDVLLFTQNVPLAIQKIQWALRTDKVSTQELERRVKKILAAKYDAGLWQYVPLEEEGITEDLNLQIAEIGAAVAKASMSPSGNPAAMIQRITAKTGNFTYLNINGKGQNQLGTELEKHLGKLDQLILPAQSSDAHARQLLVQAEKADVLVVGIHNLALYPGKNNSYGLDSIQIAVLKRLASKKKTIFVLLGNPYLQKNFCNAPAVIIGYEDNEYTQRAAADVLTSKLRPSGILPVKTCRK